MNVIGLDLSLRNAAAVFIPAGWKPGDWNVSSWSVGYALKGRDPAERAERMHHIADEFRTWIGRGNLKNVAVYVEDYAYGLGAKSGIDIAELGGAVKFALYEAGYVVTPVNQSTARSYLLGKLPQKDRAQATHAALKAWGAEFESADIGDAFVVGNYARTNHGLPGLTLGTGV